MVMGPLVGLCLVAGLGPAAANEAPIARHVTVVVPAGEDAVITLRGYDLDGEALTARVASTPETGALTQLSKVFSTYAYEPKKGKTIAAEATVTGSRNRVYYARPQYDVERPTGKWGSFTYKVSDGSRESKPGIVSLVPASRKLVASSFDVSDEGWTVVRNGAGAAATFDASSFGKGLNRFIVATDALIAQSSVAGLEANSSRFMFAAPPAYAGNQNAAYQGTLEFTLAALAGDVKAAPKGRNHNLVELECATCDVNRGTTLAFPLAAVKSDFDGSTTTFKLPLDETLGWLKDPENELRAWHPPTKCEFIEVLSGLSALRILGDFTDWYESLALDSVALLVPEDGNSHVPVCAQLTPDASSCSCA